MNKCENCEMTDEFCLSGDCPNDKTLNEQWYYGTLQRDKYYYAKDSSEGDCIVHINKSNELTFTGWEVPYKPDQSDRLEPFKLRTELLAQVPSYDEYMMMKDCAKKEFEAVERYTKLKKLLKECSMYIDWRTDHYIIAGHDRKQELFDAISEALK